MVLRREADGVAVAISPRIRLYGVLGVSDIQRRAQDGAVADTVVECALERLDSGSRPLNAERRIAARLRRARVEHVLAQDDVLAGNVLLILASAVIQADDAAVGGGTLRPVDPAVAERELFAGVVARRQSGDERRDLAGLGVDGHNSRAVVLTVMRVGGLVGIGGEQPSAAQSVLERDIDGRSMRLQHIAAAVFRVRIGGFAQYPQQLAMAVEHFDVRREWT